MRNSILLSLLSIIVFTNLHANNADVFSIDRAQFKAQFNEVLPLENKISVEGVTLSQLEINHPQLIANANIDVAKSKSKVIMKLVDDEPESKVWVYVAIGVGVLLLGSVLGCFLGG
ncbi:MAG: hypothetical protein NTX03_13770 [Bacteroidetes bacterium]|nr:hypothetical protein [Bacteroidota bacterium]